MTQALPNELAHSQPLVGVFWGSEVSVSSSAPWVSGPRLVSGVPALGSLAALGSPRILRAVQRGLGGLGECGDSDGAGKHASASSSSQLNPHLLGNPSSPP